MPSATEIRSGAPFLTAKNFCEAVLSGPVGIGVVFLIFFDRVELFGWRLVVYGALTGISIFVCCNMLLTLVGEPIHRRGILPRPLCG